MYRAGDLVQGGGPAAAEEAAILGGSLDSLAEGRSASLPSRAPEHSSTSTSPANGQPCCERSPPPTSAAAPSDPARGAQPVIPSGAPPTIEPLTGRQGPTPSPLPDLGWG